MTKMRLTALSAFLAGATMLATAPAHADQFRFDPAADGPDGIYEGGNLYEDMILGLDPTDNAFGNNRQALVETFFWQARANGSNLDSTWNLFFSDTNGSGFLDAGDRFTESFTFVLAQTSDDAGNDPLTSDLRSYTEAVSSGGAVRSSFVFMTLNAEGVLGSINQAVPVGNSANINLSSMAFTYDVADFAMFFDADGTGTGSDYDFDDQIASWSISNGCQTPNLNTGQITEQGSQDQGNLGWCAKLDSAKEGVFETLGGTDFSDLVGSNLVFKVTTSDVNRIGATALGGGWQVLVNGNLSGQETFIEIDQREIPEPMTLGLIGAGLVGLGAISRRKRSA